MIYSYSGRESGRRFGTFEARGEKLPLEIERPNMIYSNSGRESESDEQDKLVP